MKIKKIAFNRSVIFFVENNSLYCSVIIQNDMKTMVVAIFTLLIVMLIPFGINDVYANDCVGPGTSVTIDNGLTPTDDGFFQVEVDEAGDTDDVQLKPEGLPLDDDVIYDASIFYQTEDGIELLSRTTTDGPCLLPDGSVESSGVLTGSGGDQIFWTATSSISHGEVKMDTQLSFDCPDCDNNFDGLLRIHSYFDEDVGPNFSNCVLVVRGSAATNDLELFIVDPNPNSYGVSQGGAFGDSLVGATFDGWAADDFPDLLSLLNDDTAPLVSPTGIIDLDDLPAGNDPAIFDGDYWGPEDITTVMSYTLDDGASVAPLSFGLLTPAYATGMASITLGLGGVPSTNDIPDSDPEPLEHFFSYKTKDPKDSDKFEKFSVELSDALEGPMIFTVEKPERLFNPVDKNEEGLIDVLSHYVGYKIKEPKGEPKFEKIEGVTVSNQFGDITVDIKKPKLLMVPTAKDHFTFPDELNPVTVDHLKCYDVKESKDTPKFEKRNVTVFDPNFDTTKQFEIKKPKLLCIPTEKTHDGISTEINSPENNLMCYDAKKVKGEPKFEKLNVFTNNQFGSDELKVDKEEDLCVPSSYSLE
jgi:hypothetical protein